MPSRNFGALAPEGRTFFEARGVDGQLVRLAARIDESADRLELIGAMPDPGALEQETWFINANTGNDDNDGKTSATALKTFREWSNRIGSSLYVSTTPMIVTLETDLDEAEYLIRGRFVNSWLQIRGSRTTLRSGSFSAVQDLDITLSPVNDQRVTDAALPGVSWADSGPGGSSLVGKLIVLTSGAHAGKQAWILRDLGGKVARTTQFQDPVFFTTGVPAIGDNYIVVDISELGTGPVRIADSVAPFFTECNFTGTSLVQASSWGGGFESCRFGVSNDTDIEGTSLISGCLIEQSDLRLRRCNVQLFACGVTSRVLVEEGAAVLMVGTTQQQVSGAAARFLELREQSTVRIAAGGSWGILDQANAAGGGVAIRSGAQCTVEGDLWTLDSTGGWGAWIDSQGSIFWPDGDAAAAHFDFDGVVVGDFDVGGVISTIAALGVVGTITAANGAAAVPNRVLP